MFQAIDIGYQRDNKPLFKGLNFELKPGELLWVRGANGAGKSSLLSILAGLYTEFSGELRINELCLTSANRPEVFNPLVVGHQSAIHPNLTVLDNLRVLHGLHLGLGWQMNTLQLEEAIFKAGLAGLEDRPCRLLSAGQKRRVALAQLSLPASVYWILDEPFNALDSKGVNWVMKEIKQQLARLGSVILTSHQPLSDVLFSGQCKTLDLIP